MCALYVYVSVCVSVHIRVATYMSIYAHAGAGKTISKREWRSVDDNGVCDTSKGEIYIKASPGN